MFKICQSELTWVSVPSWTSKEEDTTVNPSVLETIEFADGEVIDGVTTFPISIVILNGLLHSLYPREVPLCLANT